MSLRIGKTPNGTVYRYKGEIVTGCHAVKEEGGWIRVQDSTHSEPVEGGRIVYCLITSDHRIFVNGIEFADEVETDRGCNNSDPLSLKESLFELNRQEQFIGVNGHGT